MDKATLTAKRVRRALDYNPETGVFLWKERAKGRVLGSAAGGISGNGYWAIRIDKRRYLAHRLAWLMVHGMWPEGMLDHINGDKLDNRICNLRIATNEQNQGNARKPVSNTSGFKGVYFNRGKWQAAIRISRVKKDLGRYACPTAAHIAYCKAAKEHFGEYARTD